MHMRVELSKPFSVEIGGKSVEYDVLELPLEEMTGADVIAVENQMASEGKVTVAPEFSKLFQVRLAARAVKVPAQTLERLPLRDFARVTGAVQGFLLGSGSSDPSGNESEATAAETLQGES
jgi:hypothetical protein